jgi:hypothetical protein
MMKDATNILGRSVKASPRASMRETVHSSCGRCTCQGTVIASPRERYRTVEVLARARHEVSLAGYPTVDVPLEPERGIEPQTYALRVRSRPSTLSGA